MKKCKDYWTFQLGYEMHTKVWPFWSPLPDFSVTDKSIICY